jgi:beta-lactamase class A
MNQIRTSIITLAVLSTLLTVWLALLAHTAAGAERLDPSAAWPEALRERLAEVDQAYAGEIGVYVKDLGSGAELSFRGDEYWYLASGIKVPVAVEIMRSIERGELSLDTEIALEASDYVDGAGPTALSPPGSLFSVRFLLEHMLIYSDNTASDILIRTVGVERVNRLAQELAPEGFGHITTLADVRRHAYSRLHDAAFKLTGRDFLTLREQRDEGRRLETLASLLEVTPAAFAMRDLDSAFDAYYATELNAGRLTSYGRLLEVLADGRALSAESTAYLMSVLRRTATGERRIKAGLPASASFAHKTGTQRSRACDLGIASVQEGERRLVIAACTRGNLSVAESERALRGIGEAIAMAVLGGSD